MTAMNRTAAGLLMVLLIGVVFPVTGSAQIFERQRRSSQLYNRSYQIGFDEGYRAGFEKGQEDARDGRRRDVTDFREYRKGDVGYNDRIGDREQYKLGYRAGFEKAYSDAVEGRQYGARPGDSRVAIPRGPADGPRVLRRGGKRGAYDSPQTYPDTYGGTPHPGRQDRYGHPSGGYGYPGGRRANFNTTMVIELETPITTRHNQEGDRFSAVVVEPSPYRGARVEGYIGRLERPGRVSGKGEIVLVFQSIMFPDGYSEPLQAQVEEVIGYQRGYYPRPGGRGPFDKAPWEWGRKDDRNDDIDAKAGDEGQIEGEGSRGRDAATIGAGAAAGAILGGIMGGGSGAAIGAAIGAATGGGIVATTKGHHIDLEPGAQLRIRTGQPARF